MWYTVVKVIAVILYTDYQCYARIGQTYLSLGQEGMVSQCLGDVYIVIQFYEHIMNP